MRNITIVLAAVFMLFQDVTAQMERQAAATDIPVELTFPTPRHINIPTTEPISERELYYSIMHTFGPLNSGWQNFWGIDQGANVRFSMEYGFTDRLSVTFGRSSMDRVFDLGSRIHLFQQLQDGSMPVSVSLVVSGGITSREQELLADDYSFTDRMNLAASLPVSRKFSNSLSVLVSPMFATFARTGNELTLENSNASEYLGAGLGARYKFSQTWSATFQHVTRYGMGEGLNFDVIGLGFDWETGGHVFQLYITNTQGIMDSYILAAPAGDIFDGGLRFGFNINRSFNLAN